MKTQIVYALTASPNDTFLQEMWASVYSLRLYESDREVKVLCDISTANYVRMFPELVALITEIVVINVPDSYGQDFRSREIKTSIRQHINGKFLYVDTDTLFAGSLEHIDDLPCDVAAVPEFNVPSSEYYFRNAYLGKVKKFFNLDVSDAPRLHNGGVIYAAETPMAHEFYKRWHDNWYDSAIKRQCGVADQPPLIKSDKDMGYIVEELPGEYNCQMAMCIEHFFEARIIHYIHFSILPAPQNPFMDRSIYSKIKSDGTITEATAYLIRHCKAAFVTPSCIVDGETIRFLLSNPGHVFLTIAKQGGWLLSLMNKVAALFSRILKHKGIDLWQ